MLWVAGPNLLDRMVLGTHQVECQLDELKISLVRLRGQFDNL